ncbi:hypothetical protein [Rhodococcus qingshengii]|uniref:hypothetical protein n=1 Tax=Rhodococcus qingshengii TaxID=334542 RepID=UPI00360341B4
MPDLDHGSGATTAMLTVTVTVTVTKQTTTQPLAVSIGKTAAMTAHGRLPTCAPLSAARSTPGDLKPLPDNQPEGALPAQLRITQP